MAKFEKVHCSQCGGEFGPRDSGYSHCEDHATEPQMVLCAVCGKRFHEDDAYDASCGARQTDSGPLFCSDRCANDFVFCVK